MNENQNKKGGNPSSYKGQLASQKFFTPKELNSLNLSKRPDSKAKNIVKEELKKTGSKVQGANSGL